jgi:O-antigen/teichoic acid export membrane protein
MINTAARSFAAHRASLAGNMLWNLVGSVIPLAVGLLAVPPLLDALGIDRFGILTLIWMLTGYFGFLDFGLGRALTKLVAERAVHADRGELGRLVWTALALMLAFGAFGALVLVLAADPLVRVVLNVPKDLQAEATGAVWFLALSLPLTIAGAGLRGVMDGLHLFKLANLIRMPLAALMFLAPLAVSLFTPSLVALSISLFVVRGAGLIAHWIACVRKLPDLATVGGLDLTLFRPLLGFGGWLTVSNVVGPLMTYLDRFLIGSLATLAAVAYYTTPYELVTKLLVVPVALTGVLFPTFSRELAHRSNESHRLMSRSVAAVFAVLFPVILLIVAFAQEMLALWLGAAFAPNSFRVLQWLAAGVLINAMALVPFTFVQGAGFPDRVAKLHLLELPFYLAGLWYMLGALGINGAAIAWTVRVALDALALLWMAGRAAPGGGTFPARLALTIGFGLAALAVAGVAESLEARAGIVLGLGTLLPLLVWRTSVHSGRAGAAV